MCVEQGGGQNSHKKRKFFSFLLLLVQSFHHPLVELPKNRLLKHRDRACDYAASAPRGPHRPGKSAHRFQTFFWSNCCFFSETYIADHKSFHLCRLRPEFREILAIGPIFFLEGSSVSDMTGTILSIQAVRQRRLRARPETAGLHPCRSAFLCVWFL